MRLPLLLTVVLCVIVKVSGQAALTWKNVTDFAPWSRRFGHKAVNLGFDMDIYLMGGRSGKCLFNDVWMSSDAETWTQLPDAPWSRRYDFGAVSHFEEIFVIGGETGCCLKNDIWKSANPAANWTSLGNAPFEPRASFGLVSFLGKYKLP
eukprot:TRINITY_DN4666_c0_g1_i2.p1 TRINITY_DN4666_c0_g1~~TRINITY_DN4666_c0_g1_i2.p1  ORF type:complete len:150 (-),score=40.81 TRINITY_DN4666_c0_g1_i2:79-528(-)